MKYGIIVLMLILNVDANAKLAIDKESNNLRDELQKSNLNIQKGGLILLNQKLKKKNAKDRSLYKVEFVCKHYENKKSDDCKLFKVNID